jgi:hypothetical protein
MMTRETMVANRKSRFRMSAEVVARCTRWILSLSSSRACQL